MWLCLHYSHLFVVEDLLDVLATLFLTALLSLKNTLLTRLLKPLPNSLSICSCSVISRSHLMVGQAKVTMRLILYLSPLHYIDHFYLTSLFSLAYPQMESTFPTISSKHRLGSVEAYTWEYHSLPVGVLAGCNGNICLCHHRLQSGLMLWIKSPRQSRSFQMLQNTLVCSEMLWTLCNILWLLLSHYLSMLRNLAKIRQDPTSSRCSRCCVLSHHSRFCGYTIILLFIFISVANN